MDTEDAVREFQRIFSLPVSGEVDKATWYRIKRYYNGVKQLSELTSEGITVGEASLPYAPELSAGMERPCQGAAILYGCHSIPESRARPDNGNRRV